MIKNGMTVSEAANEWVREMNAYPQDMLKTLMQSKPDDWSEVTTPLRCDRVHVYNLPGGCEDYSENGKIEDVIGETYIIKLDDGNTIESQKDNFEVERDGILPMWGWMWSFGNPVDHYWLEELDGIEQMSKCGFRVYYNENWGYFFGIDGAGYDFYSKHWIPAYKARIRRYYDGNKMHERL